MSSPNSPGVFFKEGLEPRIDVGVHVVVNKINTASYEVELNCNCALSTEKEKLYNLDINYSSIATVVDVDTFTDAEINRLMAVDVAYFIFPFLREIVSNLTSKFGFSSSVNLNPVDFEKSYESRNTK